MKRLTFSILASALALSACNTVPEEVSGNDARLTFIGRVDRSQTDGPRQWAAGGYFTFAFNGDGCEIDVTDENLYGTNYNYFEVVIDQDTLTQRVRTKGIKNRLIIGQPIRPIDESDTTLNVIRTFDSLTPGRHTVLIARDTETQMGYTQITKVIAPDFASWTPETSLKLEFIGNSITSGMDCYLDEIPYGEGMWFDRHRAYYAYGPRTARALGAQYSMASVSGIGLIHSCCEHKYVLPQIYDKINMNENAIDYDFSYVPDVVSICLGQNDGVQDSTEFSDAYLSLLKDIKGRFPDVRFALLSSPMADSTLREYFRTVLPPITAEAQKRGLGPVAYHIYERSYNSGGGSHPDMKEQKEISDELVLFLKKEVLNNEE